MSSPSTGAIGSGREDTGWNLFAKKNFIGTGTDGLDKVRLGIVNGRMKADFDISSLMN